MITDALLEYNKQWTAIANEGIGGPVPYVAPTTYTVTPGPAVAVTIAGKGYTCMMAATHRPLMPAFFPSQVYYSFEYLLQTDANVAQLQAHESEASYCWTDSKGTWYCNNSLQLNQVNPKGMIQAYASPTNVWADTGIVVPNLLPNEFYPIKISYCVDMIGRTMSTQSITINGRTYPLPGIFQKVPAISRPGWAPGIYAQIQLDLAFAGGSVTNKYSGININWE